MENKKKNKVYISLMSKLNQSLKDEFYYEAIFIEYAILEDRTESILKHSNNYRDGLTLSKKLEKIKTLKSLNNDYCKKHLNEKLINDIYVWKNERNKLIHDLIKAEYNNVNVKKVAEDGYKIVKTLNNKSILVNKYIDKISKGD